MLWHVKGSTKCFLSFWTLTIMLMHKKWCDCFKFYDCIVCGLLIFVYEPSHTHTFKTGSSIPLIHREGGGQTEMWCVNGCSCLSHPGLFFSSLTQQSISSVLEGLVFYSSWHALPPPTSLRARDEGARCAECSNIAHIHTLSRSCEKENREDWKWERNRSEKICVGQTIERRK